MIRYLSPEDLLEIHRNVLAATGGAEGIRDTGLLESAIARPQAVFGGLDLYPTMADKAAALFHSLIKNHPFIDANKRTAFTAMDIFCGSTVIAWVLLKKKSTHWSWELHPAASLSLPSRLGLIIISGMPDQETGSENPLR